MQVSLRDQAQSGFVLNWSSILGSSTLLCYSRNIAMWKAGCESYLVSGGGEGWNPAPGLIVASHISNQHSRWKSAEGEDIK